MDSRKNDLKNNLQNANDGERTSKFAYKASTKNLDPWSTNKNDGKEFDIIKSNIAYDGKKRNNQSPNVALEDVWSIRKNVQVSTSIKNGSALKTTNKSFYSRHGGLSGSGDLNTSFVSKKQKIEDIGQSSSDAKSWSVPRQGYSYSDRFSYNNKSRGTNISTSGRELGDIIAEDSNKTCDDEDFDSKKNRLNARLPVPGAPQIATREMSARTKRAQKLHQAHMKSSGFGQFSSGSVSYTRRVDDDSNVIWQKKDDLT